MTFGVGKYVAFQYSNFFGENEVIEVPEGKIRFPCFFDEAFYLNILEHDVFEDDTAVAQVSLGCDALQSGKNTIKVGL